MDAASRKRSDTWRNVGFALATIAIIAGMACLFTGHGVIGTLVLALAGMGVGALLPPGTTSTSDGHGASDSTD
jgi:hypothetical protein